MKVRQAVSRVLSAAAGRINTVARYMGDPVLLDLRRRGLPCECYTLLNRTWLREMGFRTILDIGANTGQFAVAANALFPEAAIYSFEPLPDCFKTLNANMAHAKKFGAFNLGLGAERGELQFNRSSFAPSSSFRKMAAFHREAYPWTADNQTVTVRVDRLDDAAGMIDMAGPILLKIDVQGYEDQVLIGGEQTARRATVIIIETSYVTLYEGQPLFGEIYRTLTGWGFEYKGSLEQAFDRPSGRAMYSDGVFVANPRR